jgi:hypothetical protein
MLVMRRVNQHEMRGCPADLGARHHQAEMGRLNMLPTSFKTVVHGGGETCPVAGKTRLDAAGHLFIHGCDPFLMAI